MPETPKRKHVDENTTVADYNDDYDYTLPASTLVTNKYPDVWLDSVSGSESEHEYNSDNELNPPGECDYRDKESDSYVSDLELPPPAIQKPLLKRSVAVGTGLLNETNLDHIESDLETQYDSDGDVIMQDVE